MWPTLSENSASAAMRQLCWDSSPLAPQLPPRQRERASGPLPTSKAQSAHCALLFQIQTGCNPLALPLLFPKDHRMHRLLSTAVATLFILGCSPPSAPTKTPATRAKPNAVDPSTTSASEATTSTGSAQVPRTDSDVPRKDEVRYYVGTYATMSPDGKQPYGPPVPVVGKRTLKKAEGIILEVLDLPTKHFEVTLTRTKNNTFQGTDKGKTWTGTIVYAGDDWQWNSWTYDIRLSDGSGTLKGKGSLHAGKMETDKTFFDPTGAPKALILERLQTATAAEYTAKLAALKKAGTAAKASKPKAD